MRPCSCDAIHLTEQVRQMLSLPDDQPIHVARRRLPDDIAAALACQDGELVILVDDDKPLAKDHAVQLLAEVTEVRAPEDLPSVPGLMALLTLLVMLVLVL